MSGPSGSINRHSWWRIRIESGPQGWVAKIHVDVGLGGGDEKELETMLFLN